MTTESDPRDILRAWLDENERSIAWASRQIGWTRVQLSNVVNKKRPMSRKLAQALKEKLAIPLEVEQIKKRNVNQAKEQLNTEI